MDNNEEIQKLLADRLELGKERYGHGVRVDDDTREWGTKDNDWVEMALEEALDNCIYLTAALIRIRNEKKNKRIKFL